MSYLCQVNNRDRTSPVLVLRMISGEPKPFPSSTKLVDYRIALRAIGDRVCEKGDARVSSLDRCKLV
jgi:hypothetical protein